MASPTPLPISRSRHLPEVPETLRYLSERHRLILMTKGALAEQSGKVERSGLKEYFAAVEIVAEKDPATYSRVVEKYELERDSTWMVGNSPKSDINPALAAGLNAVFVPHGDTWISGARGSQPGSCATETADRGPLRGTAKPLLKLNHRGHRGTRRKKTSVQARSHGGYVPALLPPHQTNQHALSL